MKKLWLVLCLMSFFTGVTAQSEKELEKNPEKIYIPADFYQQLGVPSIKQFWAPLDYLKTTAILQNIAKQTPQNLPHYADPTGRALMQQIVNGENLYQTLRFADTHEQRIELIMLYLESIQQLFLIYEQALSRSYAYDAEWIDIISLSSYLAALSQPEWDYYLQAPDDPSRTQKIQAVALLQTALLNPVIVGVQAIPELSALLAGRLLQQLNYSLPIYVHSLPLEASAQLQHAFMQAYQQSKDPHIREAIKILML